jgi:hypothetical protein
MAFTNVTATLSNTSSVTLGYTGSGDFADVSYYISNAIKNSGGFWNGTTFYPASSILQITVQ